MSKNQTILRHEPFDQFPATVSARPSHGPPANWRLGFWSLIVTQFQGAFNDNALKFLVIYLIVERDFPAAMRDQLVLLVGALFALPYILFSLAGGYLPPPYNKRPGTVGAETFGIGLKIFVLVLLAV